MERNVEFAMEGNTEFSMERNTEFASERNTVCYGKRTNSKNIGDKSITSLRAALGAQSRQRQHGYFAENGTVHFADLYCGCLEQNVDAM